MSATTQLPLGVTGVMLPELDFDEQIELCRSLGVTHYVFRPRHVPDGFEDKPFSIWGKHKFDLTPERLVAEGASLASKLRDAGMVAYGTLPRVHADANDEELQLHVNGAAAAGCANLRLTPPAYPQGLFDYPAQLQNTIAHYRRAVEIAAPRGIKIVIEMHTKTLAASPGLAYNIVGHFDPGQLGLILDLPNFAMEGKPLPELAVSVVRPWIDHCHVGGSRTGHGTYDRHGFRQPSSDFCAVTESDLYIPQWLAVLAELDRPVPLVIENFVASMPSVLRLTGTAQALGRVIERLGQEQAS